MKRLLNCILGGNKKRQLHWYERTPSFIAATSGSPTEHLYVLEGRRPVPANDLMEWGRFMREGDRVVANTLLTAGVELETIFLGVDHGMIDGRALLFQTMVNYEDGTSDVIARYLSWEVAEEGHWMTLESLTSTAPIRFPSDVSEERGMVTA